MNITLIASDNGLGHIRRVIYLSNALSSKNNVNLLIPKNANKKFKINKNIKVINFKMNLNVKKKSYNFNWINKLKKNILKKSDLVICDNLPEITKVYKNSLLFANFFWHHILDMNNNKKNSIDNLIKKNYLPVIGNYLFMSRKIINKFKVKKVGLFGKFKGKSKYNIRNVLVSLGTAKMGSVQLKKIKTQATNMVKRLKYTRINLYLDPIFNLKNDYKNKCKIFKANYSSRMYKKIDLAVIKPGLGTVNDCLEYAIPMICYTRNFNEEFNYNAQILKKKKLCFIINDLENVPKLIFKIIKNKKYYKDHYLSCKKLKWGGENQIQKEIELNFNEKIFC